ncbi:hypothetical protein [Streptomyces sp. NPDC096033]|uniref:hypothetical protein n=1 Tax=Streptomyces sp. NPDC096033 TaxID=3366071 RepID=UPI0037F3EC6D
MAELRARLGLTETQVRSGPDRLVDLDLLRPSRDSPGALRAVSPDLGLELPLRRQEEDLTSRQAELARSKAAAVRAVSEFADLRPDTEVDGAERLVGMDAIQSRLEELAHGPAREFTAILPGGALSEASLEASRPLDRRALGRGIEMRSVYQDSARNDPATLAYTRWLTEKGSQVRTARTARSCRPAC